MKILDTATIKNKTKRIAIQILENNQNVDIVLAGINNNGMNFAKSIGYYLSRMTDRTITYANIRLNPAKPLQSAITIDVNQNDVKNKSIVIVDDVANTGRTIFYAFYPFMSIPVKKIEIAVLVDRTHKSYPIHPNYIGFSLATTIQDNIKVELAGSNEKAVYLE